VCALAGLVEVSIRDVPTADIEINWARHGEDLVNRFEYVAQFTILFIELEAHVGSGALGEATIEVCRDLAVLCFPSQILAVSEDTSSEGRSVIAAKTDEHNSEFRNTSVSPNRLFLDDWAGDILNFVIEREAALVGHFDVVVADFLLNAWHAAVDCVRSQGKITLFRG